MELKSRQAHILRRALASERGVGIQELASKLQVSTRTLYYDIEHINGYLSQGSRGGMEVERGRAVAHVDNPAELAKRLSRSESVYFSVDERRAMEVLVIALDASAVTIKQLMDAFGMSRNTVLSDMKVVRDGLREWNLSLQSAIQSGYQLVGDERNVRKLLWQQFHDLNTPEGAAAIKRLLQGSMVKLTGNEVDFFEICRCLIKQYEIDAEGTRVFLDELGFKSLMVQASWVRSLKGHEINMDADERLELSKTIPFKSLEFSAHKLGLLGMGISPEETYYITSLFLGIQTMEFARQEEEGNFIQELSQRIIESFENIACITFPYRRQLVEQLCRHVRPLYYRLKYGIVERNPLADDIRHMYPSVYDFTRRAIRDAGSSMLSGMSDDELSYLVVYLASNFDERYVTEETSREVDKVLILGAGNMATATLVRDQLTTLLGPSFDYQVVPSGRVFDWSLDRYVLVVSLRPRKVVGRCDWLVETGPIVTEETQQRIIEILLERRAFTNRDRLIREIIEVVRGNVDGSLDEKRLYFDLFRHFRPTQADERSPDVPAFPGLLRMKDVLILPPGSSVADAVMSGAESIAGERLRSKMANLLANGRVQTYRFCEEGLLVHCPMQGDPDARVTLRVEVLPPGAPMGFGEGAGVGAPCGIRMVVCLSTVDRYAHWGLLREIYRFFEARSHVDGVIGLYEKGEEEA